MASLLVLLLFFLLLRMQAVFRLVFSEIPSDVTANAVLVYIAVDHLGRNERRPVLELVIQIVTDLLVHASQTITNCDNDNIDVAIKRSRIQSSSPSPILLTIDLYV